jgi:hypothetical protein
MIITATKLLVLDLYYRIFVLRLFRVCYFVTIAFVGLSGFACFIAQLLQCLPIRYNWDEWKKK